MPNDNATAIVVAHPDDEALWFSSVLREAQAIILCFLDAGYAPKMASGRHRALAAYPLQSMVCLAIEQAAVFNGAQWDNPTVTEFGLGVSKSDYTYPQLSQAQYKENFRRVVEALRPRLAGCRRVYTHSPWGEYGHEEHVQVYRAVKALQTELAFEIWVPNYCSNRSYPLLRRYLTGARPTLEKRSTDKELGQSLMRLYQDTQCWTWFDDYTWPDEEHFILNHTLASGTAQFGQCVPLNFIEMEPPQKLPRKRLSLTKRLRRLLGR